MTGTLGTHRLAGTAAGYAAMGQAGVDCATVSRAARIMQSRTVYGPAASRTGR